MTGSCLSFLSGLLSLIAVSCSLTTHAQNLQILKTPPTVLDHYSKEQLNDFGLKAANEAYLILSHVGSPTNQIGGELNQTDKNAVKNAKELLDEHALIQNARIDYGITKKTYIPTDIDDFKVSEMKLTRPAPDILVASYNVELPNRVDLKSGVMMSGQTAPRLTVLRWNDKKKQWLIFSQADFDTPQRELCGVDTSYRPERSSFEPADNALGQLQIETLVNTMLNEDLKSLYSKEYQVVYASGERVSDGTPRTTLSKKVEPSNLQAIKSDRLLAVRYDMPNTIKFNNGALSQDKKPRLLTYYLSDDGKWRLISTAVFAVTAKIAEGIQCVEPSKK